jgi:hypothetical protein
MHTQLEAIFCLFNFIFELANNNTRGFHCDNSYMHTIYLEQAHPSIAFPFHRPSSPSFSDGVVGFIRLSSCVYLHRASILPSSSPLSVFTSSYPPDSPPNIFMSHNNNNNCDYYCYHQFRSKFHK